MTTKIPLSILIFISMFSLIAFGFLIGANSQVDDMWKSSNISVFVRTEHRENKAKKILKIEELFHARENIVRTFTSIISSLSNPLPREPDFIVNQKDKILFLTQEFQMIAEFYFDKKINENDLNVFQQELENTVIRYQDAYDTYQSTRLMSKPIVRKTQLSFNRVNEDFRIIYQSIFQQFKI
ncbi:hypothetical protein [Vibrio aestuarianus]|uniref:hypothetical protein n=1 Tax=Vibrio aestuarianus TaxID=28171 RepID=UPI001593D18D|nr:hypothetical protein [Vibrio aestuarianus]MDE1235122.1 hypothetical protein [Vibrio aestuarianus]MDE1245995.1 hypothetical protein [Vibrio aestuarianus]NGZ63216.1 hypothetical protein [Vibrio aestuarianus subsp. cardii]